MDQLTKCHAFQVHVVVENVENSDFGWRVYQVLSLAALRVRLWSGPWVWPCLSVTHTEQRPWDVTRTSPRARH